MSVLTSPDTPPEVADRMVERWRAMSPGEKLQTVATLNTQTNALARAGIQQRHPDASEREVELRLISLRIGPDLARAAFGWDPEDTAT